ncbi:MAG TPA: class I poly(R)-hydroxyalkanoic acid synthase [Hypericibacter adhaerens]|uniref:Class I poly(R)-hydroxyalkanoic acid synthase n=1 Tax=Hypericibacter adhaerens TaxID=2602016 RepID=A0A5J6MY57_9PROT|nr:class I poly(R)-hydroxyalkanoic acid synthase [Hypericibacter adhaerens]QEX22628.1 class I poly(R)-hydroxyalkanoic acid synthase [Hypericibacter adhaerens]HWA45386.1 class I poly(R)-hydroxyalkanoic acid synthase [Hypericibacter adhaerens]
MGDQQGEERKLPDPMELSRTMTEIAEQSQRLVADFLQRQSHANGDAFGMSDPLNIGQAFLEMTARLMAQPEKLVQAQMSLWHDYMNLWQTTARRLMGEPAEPVIAPAPDDRRFKDSAWQDNELFDFVKQSYLLTARWLQSTVHHVEGLDGKTQQKVEFYTRQFVDAIAPTNFLLTNPEVLRATVETHGENLVNGLKNLLGDLERGKGELKISMTDQDAFEIGRNVAITPGKVVFQNDLMQLLQYNPTTEQVYRRPLLIIAPWINKYYILDLREKNSFIRFAVSQGHTVFVVSWVNPDEKLAQKTFEDYMMEAPLAALDAIREATGEPDANVIGYCLGGTLVASTLAWLWAKKKADRIASTTFLTTLTDFKEPGDLGVFIDEEQLQSLEARMNEKGYLEGSAMANTFNMLRANDLIWSFVINNYLLGKEPFPFDLLYWNSDSTRMPAAMHSFYLRKMYQENRLVQPGGITLAGVPIDLRKIKTPIFMLSTREDHIAPWKTTYALTQLVSGPIRFVLAASGHIAGVVNPPEAAKYHHWVNDKNPPDPEQWLATATQRPGSWWPEWARWIADFGGEKIPARKPGDGKLKVIEDAPGSYVKVRAGS